MMERLKAVAEAGERMTFEDISPHVDALNEVRFNRQKVNHEFVELDLSKPVMTG